MTWTPGSPVRLETERAVLRSLTPHDVGPAYLGWLRDPEVMRYMTAPWVRADPVPGARLAQA